MFLTITANNEVINTMNYAHGQNMQKTTYFVMVSSVSLLTIVVFVRAMVCYLS